jgi:hypothetical protein
LLVTAAYGAYKFGEEWVPRMAPLFQHGEKRK